jgi:hypothetical protein
VGLFPRPLKNIDCISFSLSNNRAIEPVAAEIETGFLLQSQSFQ